MDLVGWWMDECTRTCTCVWMGGWMDGWTDGWMDGCVSGWMDKCLSGRMDWRVGKNTCTLYVCTCTCSCRWIGGYLNV